MMIPEINEGQIRRAVANAIIDADVKLDRDVNVFAEVYPQVAAMLRTIDWAALLNAMAVTMATTTTKVLLENTLKKKEDKEDAERG